MMRQSRKRWATGSKEKRSHQKKAVEPNSSKEISPLTRLRKCITKLQSHKAAGVDETVNEFMKVCGERDGRNYGPTIQLGVEE